MEEWAALGIALVGLLGLACQWLAWRLKLPAILFLLIAGIMAGPVTGLIEPQEVLGEHFFALVSLAVASYFLRGA
ncbi:sodium/hydrogen exchanger family protein [Vibrio sp. JCM 19236]|nr:sodium/hydrogen exchanger family protein [Vibrio sp. JCM 19236]